MRNTKLKTRQDLKSCFKVLPKLIWENNSSELESWNFLESWKLKCHIYGRYLLPEMKELSAFHAVFAGVLIFTPGFSWRGTFYSSKTNFTSLNIKHNEINHYCTVVKILTFNFQHSPTTVNNHNTRAMRIKYFVVFFCFEHVLSILVISLNLVQYFLLNCLKKCLWKNTMSIPWQ